MEIELGDWATWVGSVGTVGAFLVAFGQIRRERVERHSRDRRERWERRREHADRVSAWAVRGALHVRNDSGHPLHDLSMICDGTPTPIADLVPPGKWEQAITGLEAGPVIVEFTDQRGDRWRREPGRPPHLQNAANETAI